MKSLYEAQEALFEYKIIYRDKNNNKNDDVIKLKHLGEHRRYMET